jgi:hypothetical protein
MAASRLRWRRLTGMSAVALSGIICACDSGNGYVNVRLLSPISPDRPLYVGSTSVVGLGDRVIRQKVGMTTLNSGGGWGNNKVYCKLQVGKDRITIVRVRLVSGEPRCECELRAPASTPSEPVCR